MVLFSSRLAVVFARSTEARCWVENEDVVEATPTGDASTTSEWSTVVLSIKVRLILQVEGIGYWMECLIDMAQVLYCGKQSVTSPWNVLSKIMQMTKNTIMTCDMYIISENKGDHHVITMMIFLFWKGIRVVVPVTATLSFYCHDDVIKWKPFPRYWPFVWEFTGPRWIPHTEASDAEL